jgi:hypothetical protein
MPWRGLNWSRTKLGAGLLGLIIIIQGILVLRLHWGTTDYLTVNYGFVIEIGLLVGATEMMSRYRDEPFAPLLSVPGIFYMLVNAGAAALAYYLMDLTKTPAAEPLRTFAAGIGAMAFLRSGFFTARYGSTDVAVGPNQILQVILQALDRTYDRQRAVPRSEAILEIMGGIAFDQVKEALPTLCFDLMQNVSDSEVAALNAQVRDLSASANISDDAKVLSLGLALINIVGEKTLRAAVDALGKNAQGFRRVSNQMLIDLAAIDPQTAATMLPRVCAELPGLRRRPDAQSEPPTFEVDLPGLTPESRAVLVLYKLAAHYGEQRVSAALGILMSDLPVQTNLEPPPKTPTEPDQSRD